MLCTKQWWKSLCLWLFSIYWGNITFSLIWNELEKNSEKEKSCKTTKRVLVWNDSYIRKEGPNHYLWRHITNDSTKQQQYTSNSTKKCLKWTGGVLLEIKQLLQALNPSQYEGHGPDHLQELLWNQSTRAMIVHVTSSELNS